jgi:hypothetical protein
MIVLRRLSWHRQILLWIGVAMLAVWPTETLNAANEYRDRSVIGQWKLSAVLDFAEISALDDKEAEQLLGKVLVIRRDKVSLGNRVCSAPAFLAERVDPKVDLQEKAHASAARLHLPSPVTVVEVSCAYVYIKSRKRIVLAWDGVFFEAIRIAP